MTLRLLHQTGHNLRWNQDSFTNDRCGDGFILSPVHQGRDVIEKLSVKIRRVSLFDPQYYLPNSQKTKLQTYSFFPERISKGFTEGKFASLALQSARDCVQFQLTNQFEKIVIPARYFGQMDPEYTERQESFTVLPFLKACSELIKTKRPIVLTVPLTSHMLESKRYRTSLLNWITGYTEISGVYVSVFNERETKQPNETAFLSAYMEFLFELHRAGLEVIIGHLNTEALLFSLLGDVTLTMGSFENTRMFLIDKFLVSDDDRRGPRARVYLPGLLNWVQVDQAKQVRDADKALWAKVYWPTTYGDQALEALVEPTFNQSPLYMHHFACLQRQVEALKPWDAVGRSQLLGEWINDAMASYRQIEKRGIEFEKHGAGSHLEPWRQAVEAFTSAHI